MSDNSTNLQSVLKDLEDAVQGKEDFLSAVDAIRNLPDFADFLQDKDFAGTDLRGVNFSNYPDKAPSLKEANFIEADLREANLIGLDLESATFEEAELQNAILNRAILNRAIFIKAKLNEAKLERVMARKAKLEDADLSGASLKNSDFKYSNFFKAKLINANLEKTDLSNAVLQDSDLTSANLQGANLKYANLESSNLSNANLQEAQLEFSSFKGSILDGQTRLPNKWKLIWEIVNERSNKNLENSNLSEANLNNARLMKANLRGARLSRTTLISADLSNAILVKAELNEAALSDANFSGANLTQASLKNAGLTYANLEAANLHRADLTEATLDRANLCGATLSRANLTNVSLVNANLRGADLREANLAGANLRNADLTGADIRGVRNHNYEGAILDEAIIDQPKQPVRPFVIGAIPDQDPQQLKSIYEDHLAKYLSDRLTESNPNQQRITVIYQKVDDYKDAVEGLRKGNLDMVWFGGVTGMLAQKQVPEIQAIAQRDIDKEFQSVFLVRKDCSIEKISKQEDLLSLRGKKFAFGDELSTSGTVMPLYYLQGNGFKPEDLPEDKKVFSKSHDGTIKSVRDGQVDVGVLNKQVWESRKDQPENGNLEVIWTSPHFYDYHWVIHKGVTVSFHKIFGLDLPKKVQEALINISDSIPEQKTILGLFGAKKFIEAHDDNYFIFDQILDDIVSFLPPELAQDIKNGNLSSNEI